MTAAGRQPVVYDEVISNEGLSLAMEFGEHWLQPIQARLGELFPHLSQAELDAYDAHCRDTMDEGHSLVASVLVECGGPTEDAQPRFRERLLSKYAWISPNNAGRLFSQGCYYALK